MVGVNGPLGHIHTCDFSGLLRLFCDKMGVGPNWKTCHKTITRAQKPARNRKYKRGGRTCCGGTTATTPCCDGGGWGGRRLAQEGRGEQQAAELHKRRQFGS